MKIYKIFCERLSYIFSQQFIRYINCQSEEDLKKIYDNIMNSNPNKVLSCRASKIV